MQLRRADLVDAALELSSIAGVVANVCDHVEHNESADPTDIRAAGERLRSLASHLADCGGFSLQTLYRDRIAQIEARNVVHHDGSLDGAALIDAARSLRELQLAQIEHDRYYHLDVIGLTKADQLRHYALHLAKLAGAAADTAENLTVREDFVRRRLPDVLLFGIKLATVSGQKLPEQRLSSVREVSDCSPRSSGVAA
jgi:hypothetical protein